MSIESSPEKRLARKDYALLFAVGLAVCLIVAALQPVPGYMDADYYYAGGMRLASGRGFTDALIWNYLDQPKGLPHPSNSYWYPMASLIAAGGMFLTGKINFISARIGFILLATLAPLFVAALAYRITGNRFLSITSGCLAIFSGYYLPFIVTTDNYGLFIFIGAVYFLLLDRMTLLRAILLGLLAGVINLARADGILWLPLTLFAVVFLAHRNNRNQTRQTRVLFSLGSGLMAVAGYLIIMGAWFVRSLSIYGSILPPGSSHIIWMTSYNQLYSFTPEIYTVQSWLASGWLEAVKARFAAAGQNLGTAFFAEGMIFLAPLIIVGAWKIRHSFRIQLCIVGWLILFLIQSILFPFASVRGGFFHAETVFQPLWFVLAPLGLNSLLETVSRGRRTRTQLTFISQSSLIVISVVLSIMLVKIRVVDSGWNEGEYLYQKVEQVLHDRGAGTGAIIAVRNPPAYFIMTERSAIVVPYGNIQTLLEAMHKYGAQYVVIEYKGIAPELNDLYQHPENHPEFNLLDTIDDNLIFSIQPAS